jgi:DNA-binding MarR family transcriptional regulator
VPKNQPSTTVLTGIILDIFRLNARLLEQGDRLVAPLGLTSARWQVLGAIALAGQPLTIPQIAAAMGITRQGALKQIKLATASGLVAAIENPRHERSPLHALTPQGTLAYDAAMALQGKWVRTLARDLPVDDLQATRRILAALEERLAADALP